MGWRWQNPPNEEALTALKGLAYLKREVIRVQDQVYELEGKLLEARVKDIQEVENGEIISIEKETNVEEPSPEELEAREIQSKETYNYSLFKTQKGIMQSEVEPQPQPHLSPKYQEVLELAANGQRIPEIAQRLFLSQDAVRMVLRMQPDGGKNS
ncbi:DNA-binding response regulator [Desulfosporosinus nitroreducens]|uniref:DNA-binding response regulator n=1 Tax=Desulfosporosinus nitroreducens TaxID=2018668 RepID=A0ABT8QRV9_9FIRM|nr:DNA-binding response regulator [Desulfosporosinus nitroreducens]MCO1602686.1 DNA-binding response regulator [Desulfosporosinus nitroreducens]MDO0823607.1 DNA-binding response regulator [Desulfosporosinus nitroreducens]